MPMDRHLGKSSSYPSRYAPELLVSIPRADGRRSLDLEGELPFDGVDVWNAYELSWLNRSGKPVVATAELWIPATSPNLVESKSLKLYLHSLNGMHHESPDSVCEVIRRDVEGAVEAGVDVRLFPSPGDSFAPPGPVRGTCIDTEDVTLEKYHLDATLLSGAAGDGEEVEETLHSHLLKSNCPVTGQPDWATLVVHYRGPKIDRAALLRYVVSYREHQGFHEHCVERIFVDLQRVCRPHTLSVLARYTRRGGIDINPFRSDGEPLQDNLRTWRQ